MRILTWVQGLAVGLLISSQLLAADVVLNEYNAVGSNNRLDGGLGADSFFGLIDGNGGNWFELAVVGDHVDMRGWKLIWGEDEQAAGGGTAAGTITLSNDPLWADLRSGSLITLIETADAGGHPTIKTPTDVSYDPSGGDWWINIATQFEATRGAQALATTVTNDGVAGDFSVGRNDWTLLIQNASGGVVFGPAGEGAAWAGDGISNEEGGNLEGPLGLNGQPATLAQWQEITPASPLYDDTGSTTFGAINADYNAANQSFIPRQDFSPLRSQITPPTNDGDFDNDGQLTAADIDALTLAVRGGSTETQYDLDANGSVNGDDRQVWVEGLKQTYFGDANLDGEFNTSDFVFVLTAGQYEDAVVGNSTWATGDWDGDGDFTTSDFVKALQGGGYELGPRSAVAAVPEPASSWLLALGLLSFGTWRRCR